MALGSVLTELELLYGVLDGAGSLEWLSFGIKRRDVLLERRIFPSREQTPVSLYQMQLRKMVCTKIMENRVCCLKFYSSKAGLNPRLMTVQVTIYSSISEIFRK